VVFTVVTAPGLQPEALLSNAVEEPLLVLVFAFSLWSCARIIATIAFDGL
jgi:hypothetical protein